jgi:hypothetical protein
MNLRLPPTALGSGFDLLALRARCKRELTACRGGVQVARRRFAAICGRFRLRRAGWCFVPCALGVHAKIHRAGGAFVHLPCEPLASAYGPQERLRSTRAPCSVQGRIYGLRRVPASLAVTHLPHFARAKLSTFPRLFRRPGENPVDQWRSPVAGVTVVSSRRPERVLEPVCRGFRGIGVPMRHDGRQRRRAVSPLT